MSRPLQKLIIAADVRKGAEPIFAALERLEKRVKEIAVAVQPVRPEIMRRAEPAPANDPNYVAVADLLEKAARAGLGREFDDAASILRRRCDSAPAMAAASAIDHQNFRGWK